MADFTLRQNKLLRWGALQTERASWITRYQELSEYMLPFSGRFFAQDHNKVKSFNSIYDSTATRALRILSAGLMSGVTSPARPWFRLATSDRTLMDRESVLTWLNDVTELMRDIFARSNTYRALHTIYEELGCFATAATIVQPNYDFVIWHHPLTAGEYAIACDPLGRVNTLYREFEMTVAQIVEEFVYDRELDTFTWDSVSASVKNAWDLGRSIDTWRPVLHAIEPRHQYQRDATKKDAKNMPWSSCYLEQGTDENRVLRESGYKDFPVLGPRWHTRGRDVYGNGPGMEALGDTKQLQHEQLRKGQGIDFMSLPPIGLPGTAKGHEVDRLPGGVTYLGDTQTGAAKNLFDVRLDLNHLLADIQDVRNRINQAFYADLFMMISNDQRRMPVTAREIAERHEEKLLMLGPVLERLHDELLSPLIDITFSQIVQSGMLPRPPQEMQGMDINIEFVSMLAQAQKAIGLGSFDRLIGTVGAIAAQSQRLDVFDKLDMDQIIDKYSDMLAVDPSVIVADDKVAIVRQNRAQQMQAAQQQAQMPAAAQAAKNLSQSDPEQLQDVMKQFTGYGNGR